MMHTRFWLGNVGAILKALYPQPTEQATVFSLDRDTTSRRWRSLHKRLSKRDKRLHGDHRRWQWIARYGSVEAAVFWEMGMGAWLPGEKPPPRWEQ